MHKELLSVYHFVLVEDLEREDDLRAVEFGPEWGRSY